MRGLVRQVSRLDWAGFRRPGFVRKKHFAALAVGVPQHPDERRPQRPVLLAVDQELGESRDDSTDSMFRAICFGPALRFRMRSDRLEPAHSNTKASGSGLPSTSHRTRRIELGAF
jgi:hypothetical protein